MISTEQMKITISNMNWAKAVAYISLIDTILPNFGIDTPLRKAHFLAQLAHESGGLNYSQENLNYSAQGLRSVFSKYFKTMQMAEAYALNRKKSRTGCTPIEWAMGTKQVEMAGNIEVVV